MLGTFCDCSVPGCGGGLVEDCIDSVGGAVVESVALEEFARLDWTVELVGTADRDSPPGAEEVVVGCTGELGTTGEDGESRSLEPDESFVRFFFKNPRVGMKAGYLSVDVGVEGRGAGNKEADKKARSLGLSRRTRIHKKRGQRATIATAVTVLPGSWDQRTRIVDTDCLPSGSHWGDADLIAIGTMQQSCTQENWSAETRGVSMIATGPSQDDELETQRATGQ